MLKLEDFRDPDLHARAEPDDEYYWRPQPSDPHQIDPDSHDEDEEGDEQDEPGAWDSARSTGFLFGGIVLG